MNIGVYLCPIQRLKTLTKIFDMKMTHVGNGLAGSKTCGKMRIHFLTAAVADFHNNMQTFIIVTIV